MASASWPLPTFSVHTEAAKNGGKEEAWAVLRAACCQRCVCSRSSRKNKTGQSPGVAPPEQLSVETKQPAQGSTRKHWDVRLKGNLCFAGKQSPGETFAHNWAVDKGCLLRAQTIIGLFGFHSFATNRLVTQNKLPNPFYLGYPICEMGIGATPVTVVKGISWKSVRQSTGYNTQIRARI